MKTLTLTVMSTLVVLFAACDEKKTAPAAPSDAALRAADMPLLPVTKGDAWFYDVLLEIPAAVTSPGAAAVETRHERVRTYLGKISAAEGLPETDCFEVKVPGSPAEREFVEIHDDRILMRGTLIMRQETTKPMWLATPVPYVMAGVKPGTAYPEFSAGGGLTRKVQVIAREDVTVPAGTFHCIRILTTGNDGDLELRRSTWFAPGKGIIREEKTRYRGDKLLFRETQELTELRRGER
jgi:hypothetical protein